MVWNAPTTPPPHVPLDAFLALLVFAFVTSITPGPNNLMLLASGVNCGLRRTLPHMLGIGIGFVVLVIAVGFGLGRVFEAFPATYTILRLVGVAYLLWLAWTLARSGPIGEGARRGRPMTFIEAAAFQWVNPKAWVMAVSAIAAYTLPDDFTASLLAVALVFGAVNLPHVSSWALFGVALRGLLTNPRSVRVFNITMALLLVASLWPIVAGLVF